jgi:hypothetical protein
LGRAGLLAATKRPRAGEAGTGPRLSAMQRSGMERADKLGVIPYKWSVHAATKELQGHETHTIAGVRRRVATAARW